jgi:hypothetical protein
MDDFEKAVLGLLLWVFRSMNHMRSTLLNSEQPGDCTVDMISSVVDPQKFYLPSVMPVIVNGLEVRIGFDPSCTVSLARLSSARMLGINNTAGFQDIHISFSDSAPISGRISVLVVDCLPCDVMLGTDAQAIIPCLPDRLHNPSTSLTSTPLLEHNLFMYGTGHSSHGESSMTV